MELSLKTVIVLVPLLAGAIAFVAAWFFIQRKNDIAKRYVDLIATISGASSFIAAVFAVANLLVFHNGKWLLDYPLIGEPSVCMTALPVFLGISLGLSLASRLSALTSAVRI